MNPLNMNLPMLLRIARANGEISDWTTNLPPTAGPAGTERKPNYVR